MKTSCSVVRTLHLVESLRLLVVPEDGAEELVPIVMGSLEAAEHGEAVADLDDAGAVDDVGQVFAVAPGHRMQVQDVNLRERVDPIVCQECH